MEHRVVAGSPLIAITSNDADMLRRALAIFARSAAAYIGLARTDSAIDAVASRLLVTGPRGGGSVVIADAISPLHRLAEDGPVTTAETDIVGREVVSREGERVGEIVDILYEVMIHDTDGDGQPSFEDAQTIVPRYVIVGFGGVLRMGRHRTAVPAEIVDTARTPVVIDATREFIQAAPRFDFVSPLSRQDEVTIRQYFNIAAYWLSPPE
jgi:hypothetical protein